MTKLKHLQRFPYILFFISAFSFGQNTVPAISARVDTTHIEVKKVYHLYKDYLNSRPDSIYMNPHWNKKEAELIIKAGYSRVDRSADRMYNYQNASEKHAYYIPTILQIDKIEAGRYQIKTLFAAQCPDPEYKKFTPDCITKLYAVKNEKGEYKLENAISYDTRNWRTYQYKFIKYIVDPDCAFDKKEAKKATAFCEDIAHRFDLKVEPFTYYMLPNSDEFGKLYNFEYWLSYSSGQTSIPLREIFTSFGNEQYPHEFVHILFPLAKEPSQFCPPIINEGLATWLAGPSLNETFEDALTDVSKLFQQQKNVTLQDVMTFNVRNEFDNNVLYVTGGVICKMVYESHGKSGIWKLYNSNSATFKSALESIFGLPYEEVDMKIIDYIRNYSKT